MTDPPNTDELVDAIHEFAAEQMNERVPPAEIQESLIEKGLDRELAAVVLRNLLLAQSNAVKAQGRSNMLYGAVWCLGGIVVLSLRSGMADAGLATFLTWAAIIFGGINLIRGLTQLGG
jgi:hypothetical protein